MKNLTNPPYVSPSGKFYTKQLFWEVWNSVKIEDRDVSPVFSLHIDRPGLINARRTFIDLNDPTGYKWALEYLGTWKHWEALQRAPWFVEAVSEWREELKIKMASESLTAIKEIADGSTSNALAANKYLVEQGWLKSGRGRPSREELKGELKKRAEQLETTNNDLERIGLKLVYGGASE